MIYFDSAATTRPYDEVLERFSKDNLSILGNPAAIHALGYEATRFLEKARKEVLDCFGVPSTHNAIFLSGATEGNNLALKGIAYNYSNRGKRILISASEHPSVLEPAKQLQEQGFQVERIDVLPDGRVDIEKLRQKMDGDVILVSIMGVNNETGAINDIAAIADIVHAYPKAFFHSDLTQAVAKTAMPYGKIDLFSFSGHKVHGLKGSGALIYRKNIKFSPLIDGGKQESGFRSGTVSVPLADTMALALSMSMAKEKENEAKAREIWNVIDEGMRHLDVTPNSFPHGSPFVYNFTLNHHKASVIAEALSQKEIYVSTTSSCSSKKESYSLSVLNMGRSLEEASNSIRLSFDGSNNVEEAKAFLITLETLLKEVHPR